MLSTHSAIQNSVARLDSRWAFAACWIAAGMLLYLAGTPPTGPAVFPDEVCRLGWARLLSGTGPHYEMSPAAYCQPYYALLLAPLHWLTHDPAAVQNGVFAINTAFAAACLPLAVRLGIRHFGLGVGTAWVSGIAILAYPSLTLYSHHAMPETVLFPGLLLAFALWCNLVDEPTWRKFTALLAMSLVLYALHRKMLVVPLALMVGLIVGCWFDRTPEYRMRTLLTALTVAAAFWLDNTVKSVALSAHLQAGDAGAVELLTRLSSLQQIQTSTALAAGVLVYATLVTGGCIWLILGSGMDSIHRCIRHDFESLDEFTKKSAFAFGMVALLGGVTAMYFGGGTRFDLWFYGRHVDSSLGVALLPAIAMIARRRVGAAVLRWAIAMGLLAFLVLAFSLPGPPWADFSPIHVIGAGRVMEWMYTAADRWILLGYCAAILAMAVAMYLARLPGLFRFAALIPFAVVATTIHLTTQPFKGIPIETAIPKPAADMLRKADPCYLYYDSRGGGRLRLHQYFRLQYHFPHCSIELVSFDQPHVPGSLLVVKREYADCGSGTECHYLNPDLVLHRIAGE